MSDLLFLELNSFCLEYPSCPLPAGKLLLILQDPTSLSFPLQSHTYPSMPKRVLLSILLSRVLQIAPEPLEGSDHCFLIILRAKNSA